MTDYTSITGVPVGQNAFTALVKRVEKPESAVERNLRKNRENYHRKLALKVNPYSDIGRTTGKSNSEKAAR